MRPRIGLLVVLDGKDRQLAMAQSFDRAVVEIDVCDLERRSARGRPAGSSGRERYRLRPWSASQVASIR